MLPRDQDTIVAVATAPGRGGIGVVRLSGPQARTIAECLLPPERRALRPRHAHFSPFLDADGELIDEGLVLWFPAPRSFTGEDVVELQGHGGPVVLDRVVRACIAAGARQARAGEFSLRAFLNDRMDLAQAEAIADLIDASTVSAARAAMRSLQGEFSRRIDGMVERLIRLRMYVEAAIDFPEEEIDFLADAAVVDGLTALIDEVGEVLASSRRGRVLREGFNVVIAGRPNAGKSSLLNALAGHDSAIVTDIAGTTRDVLRERIDIDGLPVNIVDTAGLRVSADPVEQEGIRRARDEIARADLVLVVADLTACHGRVTALADVLSPDELDVAGLGIPLLLVLNKLDLQPVLSAPAELPAFPLSALDGSGLPALRDELRKRAGYQDAGEGEFSARRRHVTALEQALAALEKGHRQLAEHRAGELLAEDLRTAQQALEEITGAFTSDDLLGRIFSSFCIGK